MKTYLLEMTLSDSVDEDKVNIGWNASEVFGSREECINKALDWYRAYWRHIVDEDDPTMEVNAKAICRALADGLDKDPAEGFSLEYGYPVDGYMGLIEITPREVGRKEDGKLMLDNPIDEQEQRLLKKELDEFHRMDRFIADHQLQHPVYVYTFVKAIEGSLPETAVFASMQAASDRMSAVYLEMSGKSREESGELSADFMALTFHDTYVRPVSLSVHRTTVDKNLLEDADHE